MINKINEEIHVKIAEVKTGFNGEVLKITLGSCVGILFKDKRNNHYALAHCLLPFSDRPKTELSARYVDHAIESLIEMLKIKKDEYSQIEVSIFGGANMMSNILQANIGQVGNLNIESAKKKLVEHGFVVKFEDVGGLKGRKVIIQTKNHQVDIVYLEKVGKFVEVA